MSDTKKVKGTATVLLGIVGVILLYFAITQVRSFFLVTGGWNAVTITNYILGLLFILLSLGIGSSLLHSIRKDETPFKHKNVWKLKAIAILLIVFEAYFYLSQFILHRLFPIIIDEGTRVEAHSSLGGIVISAGLVVYCVALVFEYGISLQNQVDETL